MWNWLKNLFSRRPRRSALDDATAWKPAGHPSGARRIGMRASYDAALTDDHNKRHFAFADGKSANAANSPQARLQLRKRARYEFSNNTYCQGLVLTLANDMVGTGPSLQVLTASDPVNRAIETAFAEWAEAVGLAGKLHVMRQAKCRDGETFALLHTNEALRTPVQLDLDPIEADQVATPALVDILGANWVDGIVLDDNRNPVSYHILRYHPGDLFAWGVEYETWSARNVIHWFRRDRPRQYRGVPEITAALPLFAQLRRYTLATLSAAEIAADFAAVLQTAGPGETDDLPNPFESLEIDRGMMTTLPAGATMEQFRANQPTTGYQPFKHELLKEIGRCVNMPANSVLGDSSGYNYSSARLDHLLYRGSLRVERNECRRVVLEHVFRAWYAEARLVADYLPAGLLPGGLPQDLPHAWYWPGFASIDPVKEAVADAANLANCTTTLAELAAEDGKRWDDVLAQRARELDRMRELGIPVPGQTAPTPAGADPGDEEVPADDPDEPKPGPGDEGGNPILGPNKAYANGFHRRAVPCN